MANSQSLWDELCKGKPDALDAMYREHGAPLRAFLVHYTGNFSIAEDLTQETFLELWKKPNGFDAAKGTLKQYLFGIGRKRAAMWRRHALRPQVEIEKEPRGGASDDSVVFRSVFDRLDADDRALLWLREVEGYSYGELSEILAIPVGTVKSRLFAARESLRAIWHAGRNEEQEAV